MTIQTVTVIARSVLITFPKEYPLSEALEMLSHWDVDSWNYDIVNNQPVLLAKRNKLISQRIVRFCKLGIVFETGNFILPRLTNPPLQSGTASRGGETSQQTTQGGASELNVAVRDLNNIISKLRMDCSDIELEAEGRVTQYKEKLEAEVSKNISLNKRLQEAMKEIETLRQSVNIPRRVTPQPRRRSSPQARVEPETVEDTGDETETNENITQIPEGMVGDATNAISIFNATKTSLFPGLGGRGNPLSDKVQNFFSEAKAINKIQIRVRYRNGDKKTVESIRITPELSSEEFVEQIKMIMLNEV